MWLDFVITFEREAYNTEKFEIVPKLLLKYPDDYSNSMTIFPIIITVDEIDFTATGELLSV